MKYSIHSIFPTIQGEGCHSGRPAVFCRLAGCNLWSGKEKDRSSAVCQFCDTDFSKKEELSGYDLMDRLLHVWHEAMGRHDVRPFVVFTGGEPMLQLKDGNLVSMLKKDGGFYVAVETNGTVKIEMPILPDWITISPKAGSEWIQRSGSELKIVWPQDQPPRPFVGALATLPQSHFNLQFCESLPFNHFWLQPKDSPDPKEKAENLRRTISTVMARPNWRISVQTHKIIGVD